MKKIIVLMLMIGALNIFAENPPPENAEYQAVGEQTSTDADCREVNVNDSDTDTPVNTDGTQLGGQTATGK